MAAIVSMDAKGQLTVPASVRHELGLEGDTQFEAEVVEGRLILRPVVMLSPDDAWAYTPEHRQLLEQAHRDSREGRVRQMTEEELSRFAD